MALKSVLKKGADLYRYAVKISKEIKTAPKRQQSVSVAPKKRRLLAKIFGLTWLWFGIALLLQVGALTWAISSSSPLDKGMVMRIALASAGLMTVILLIILDYLFSRTLEMIGKIVDVVGSVIGLQSVLAHDALSRAEEEKSGGSGV